MDELKKALRDAASSDLPVTEFRQTLRHELLAELHARETRRPRGALLGLSAAAALFAVACVTFVLRPAVAQRLHSALFHDDVVAEQPADDAFARILTGAGADLAWVEGQAAPARVKRLDDERFFALRRFELTSGERIVVLTEIEHNPGSETQAALPAVRTF